MIDPIERQDAIEVVKRQRKIAWENCHETRPSAECIIEDLKELPSAQPEIIRCGECKYMMEDGRCYEFADDNIRPSASDFCSYAERKANE